MVQKQILKRLLSVYIAAFVLNFVWEVLHSALYVNYQGGAITSLLLFRAALVDAAIILALVFIAQQFTTRKTLFVVLGGLLVAILIEMWALQTSRWVYSSAMPIIPIIKTGLTPTVQLALTGYLVKKLIFGRH